MSETFHNTNSGGRAMDIQSFGDADKARRRRRASRKGTRCHVEKVRGGRYMLLCPHKRPKFISASRAKSFHRGRR